MAITDEGIKLNVPLAEMSDRKDVVLKEGYLLLYDKFVRYKMVGTYAGKDEEDELWKDKIGNFRWTRMRSDIADVSMCYDNKEELWYVTLQFTGDLYTAWYYKEPKEALKLYNLLDEYLITRG